MRVRYTPEARSNLESISAFLEERAPSAARRVIATIEAAIAHLSDYPFMAPATDEPSVFELTIVRYPYKVYYQVEGEEVWIIHVRDARQEPWVT